MNVLGSLLCQVAGGATASWVDREYGAQYSQTIPGTSVKLTPGAMGAIAGALLIAAGVPVPGREVLANMVGGALVYEGTKLAEDQVLPRLTQASTPAALPTGAPAGAAMGMGFGYPAYGVAGMPVSDFALDQALRGRRFQAAA